MEEENTTFGDPKEGRDDDRQKEEIAQLDVMSEDVEKPEIEIVDGEAIMRIPKKEKKSQTAPQPTVRNDSIG